MSNKVEVVRKDTFDIIKSAVDKTVSLIKPTFGPANNKVVISKMTHGFVLDDGVQIVRDLELEDAKENAIMKIVRETAIKTNDRVGDGTTGSMIILQAIIEGVSKLNKRDGHKIEKELKAGFEECKRQLLETTKKIETKEQLRKVARVSFDDERIANLIADAWFDLGVDGVLTVDRSNTMETTVEVKEGISINNGYISPYMITNPERMECVVEKPYILLTDYRLTEAKDVIGIMGKLLEKGITNLVFIAENIEQSALNTLVVNKLQGKFNAVAVNAPKGANVLEDIGLLIGAKVFSQNKGDKLEDAEVEDLGRAGRFIAKRAESIIVDPSGDKDVIQESIESLKKAVEEEPQEKIRKSIKQRIARFSNKIGVVKVGAPTENEMKALKYKVEDAVNAVQAAYRGGITAGGGGTLMDLNSGCTLLDKALEAPFETLMSNSDLDYPVVYGDDDAIDMSNGNIGQWEEIGVIDATDVLIAQIESAVSIAGLLVTTTGMIVERPAHIKEQ